MALAPVKVNNYGVDMNEVNLLQQAALERIAGQIRRLRAGRNLTQESLSQKAAISPRHFQKIEAAQVNVTVHSLVRIANALGVDVATFFLDDCFREQ